MCARRWSEGKVALKSKKKAKVSSVYKKTSERLNKLMAADDDSIKGGGRGGRGGGGGGGEGGGGVMMRGPAMFRPSRRKR